MTDEFLSVYSHSYSLWYSSFPRPPPNRPFFSLLAISFLLSPSPFFTSRIPILFPSGIHLSHVLLQTRHFFSLPAHVLLQTRSFSVFSLSSSNYLHLRSLLHTFLFSSRLVFIYSTSSSKLRLFSVFPLSPSNYLHLRSLFHAFLFSSRPAASLSGASDARLVAALSDGRVRVAGRTGLAWQAAVGRGIIMVQCCSALPCW